MLGVVENCLRSSSTTTAAAAAAAGIALRGGTVVVPAAAACVQYQSVRHYPRKPRWLPIAKSKMYKIIQVPVPPKLEHEEMTAIREEYNLYNRSLWSFQSQISREREVQMQKEARQVSEEVELERIFKINDAENERIRKIREVAVVQEWKDAEKEILERKKRLEDGELKRLEQTELIIASEVERLKGAIKLEELDEVIEKALAAETDHNFAIARNGQIYQGRNNNAEGFEGPPPVEPIIKPLEVAK